MDARRAPRQVRRRAISTPAIDMFQAIAPNAFFVFAGTFPTNNAVANLLLGAPVTFYQGLGDFSRGMRVWGAGAYAQDEWRVGSAADAELRPALRAHQPDHGGRGPAERVRARRAVDRRARRARRACVFPGDPGIAEGIAQSANGVMPRVGFAWDPTGAGVWSVRASYGLFYDQFQNGAGTASQVPISSMPWAQFNQFSGAGPQLPEPVSRATPIPRPNTFVRPSTVFAIDAAAKPPYTQNWNVSVQRSLFEQLPARGPLRRRAKGERLPRNVEANPAVYGPGATAQNADRRRIYANCPADGGTCDFSTIAMLRNITHSNYQAGQSSLSRRYADGVGFNVWYWLLEADRRAVVDEPVGRGGQAARGRERPGAEPVRPRAPSTGRRCSTRGTGSSPASAGSRSVPDSAPAAVRAIFGGWQINGDRDAQLGHAVHGVRFGERVAAGQQPADLRASRPAGRTSSAIRTPGRTRSTRGSAASAFQRLEPASRRPGSSATPAATSRAARLHQRRRFAGAQLRADATVAAAVPRRDRST